MAPETLVGELYSYPVDYFAYGMFVYHVLTEKSPSISFGAHAYAIAQKIVGGNRPPFPKGTLRQVTAFIEDCWAQDPALRIGFDEIVRRLEAKEFLLPNVDVEEYDGYIRSLNLRTLTFSVDGRTMAREFPMMANVCDIEKTIAQELGTMPCKIESESLSQTGMDTGVRIGINFHISFMTELGGCETIARQSINGRRHARRLNPQSLSAFSRGHFTILSCCDSIIRTSIIQNITLTYHSVRPCANALQPVDKVYSKAGRVRHIIIQNRLEAVPSLGYEKMACGLIGII
jgi:hypothetical protein